METLDSFNPATNSTKRNFSYSEDNLHKTLENFLTILKLQLSKSKYKKVIKDIQSKENIYAELPSSWKLKELKIRAMLKLIERKLNKLETNEYSILEIKLRTRSIEEWLHRLDTELQSFFNYLSLIYMNNFEDNEFLLELTTQFILEELFLWAEHSNNNKLFRDCVAFLGISERIINTFIDFSKDPKTVNIAQKTFLFISSLLISDCDYENAINYQMRTLNLCFRELFIRVDLFEGIIYENLSEKRRHYLNKIFTNIAIAFYQRGVCLENLGEIVKAIESYRQSRFFVKKFLKNDHAAFTEFVSSVEKRANSYYAIINNIKNKEVDQAYLKKENYSLSKSRKENKKHSSLNLVDPFRNLENDLQKLDVNSKNTQLEFDPNKKKDEKINYILSTVNLIELLLSNDFKDIVQDMKELNITKIDIETLDRIQNRINELRKEKNKTNNLNITAKTIEANKSHFRNLSGTSTFQIDVKDILSNQSSYNNSPNSKKNNGKRSSRTQSTLNINNGSNFSNFNIFPITSQTINKNVYDQYVFSQNFHKKINYLKQYENRELNFQKQLLDLKKKELCNTDEIGSHFKQDYEGLLNRAVSARIPYQREAFKSSSTVPRILSDIKIDDIIIDRKRKLETSVIKSLSTEKFKELKCRITNSYKPTIKQTNPNPLLKDDGKSIMWDKKLVNLHNTHQFSKITKEIEILEKTEKLYDEAYNTSGPIDLKRKITRNKSTKENKNMDYFVKSNISKN